MKISRFSLVLTWLFLSSAACLPAAEVAATTPPATNHTSQPNSLQRGTLDLSGPGWFLWRDEKATWRNDNLFLPPVNLSEVPSNPPTGGWEQLVGDKCLPVSVPGTAEEYLGKGLGPDSMVSGVTWWFRDFTVPANADGKVIRLLFDAARQRAEVYANGKLVGYDIVGNTPFEADLTGVVKPGEKVRLAVRITNPGGTFGWGDHGGFRWGKYLIPMSHAFGGVTGGVHLSVTDKVYVDDLYVQNKPTITEAEVITTVRNTTGTSVKGSLEVSIREKATGKRVFTKKLPDLDLKTGNTEVRCPVSVPDARVWNLDSPNLYEAEVHLTGDAHGKDVATRPFGFRWFAPEGIGSNALLRLDGKRIVLRTAISWGYWPINGIFPSPELAAKEIAIAKAYGLNMLNFHRCIGNPISLDKADEMGLLYFEEPGGYTSAGKEAFAQALAREKLLRMVKRDRSHPSLIIYNMINEQWASSGADKDPALFEVHRQDLCAAHALDPSRTILYTSSWATGGYETKEQHKMHMRPFDDTVQMNGWWDHHHAGGPWTWQQSLYLSPTNHYCFTDNKKEVIYLGEEGAISSPPRLGLINKALEGAANLGWDGQVYRNWYQLFDDYLTANNLRAAFPTVDDLCKALGVVSLEHQGRKIEDDRICDANDGYAINGWESEIEDNYSGVVDCFRNPVADPAIMAYYNQPLYVAVKPRAQFSTFPGRVTVDFYVINEKDLKGNLTLKICVTAPSGKTGFAKDVPVKVTGGDVSGELIAEAVEIPITEAQGMQTITATLVDSEHQEKATGHDQVLALDWKSIPIAGMGAVLEDGGSVRQFLKKEKGIDVPLFDNTKGRLDWILVAKSAFPEPVPLAGEALCDTNGKPQKLKTTFFEGDDFSKPLCERNDASLDFKCIAGANPDPQVQRVDNYSIRWEGNLQPPAQGDYEFTLSHASSGARVWINGQQVFDQPKPIKQETKKFTVTLPAGKPVPIRVELIKAQPNVALQLLWNNNLSLQDKQLPEQVFDRARRDGTMVLILDRAESWLPLLATATAAPQPQSFTVGGAWEGGQFFVKEHPLFAGLPVNQALNWPYQSVVSGGRKAFSIRGEEIIAGAYQNKPMQLGAAVSILPLGKGKVLLSTLEIIPQINNGSSSAEVARRLFCNFINYAGSGKSQ